MSYTDWLRNFEHCQVTNLSPDIKVNTTLSHYELDQSYKTLTVIYFFLLIFKQKYKNILF